MPTVEGVLGLFLRCFAAQRSCVAAGGVTSPAWGEGARCPVCLCPGRQGSHGWFLMRRKLVAEKWNISWNNICLQRTAKGKPVFSKASLNPYPISALTSLVKGTVLHLLLDLSYELELTLWTVVSQGAVQFENPFWIWKETLPTRNEKQSEALRIMDTAGYVLQGLGTERIPPKGHRWWTRIWIARLEFAVFPWNLDTGQAYKETCWVLDGG